MECLISVYFNNFFFKRYPIDHGLNETEHLFTHFKANKL